MNATFPVHWDTLPETQKFLWPHLSALHTLGYVLYGSTAIALRLGHRHSVGFDFLTQRPLNSRHLRSAMPILANCSTLHKSDTTLTVVTEARNPDGSGVELSFYGAVDSGRLGTPQWTDDRVLQVASIEDLLATKLKLILERVDAKDYRDIIALVQSGAEPASGLAGARRLFGHSFHPSAGLMALTWFEGGDLDALTDDEQKTLTEIAASVTDLPHVELVSRSLQRH